HAVDDRVQVADRPRRQSLALTVILPAGLLQLAVVGGEALPGDLRERQLRDGVRLDVAAEGLDVRRAGLGGAPTAVDALGAPGAEPRPARFDVLALAPG